MKNYDMKELEAMIPSVTVREYILEKGWDFTDREKACLLLHNMCLMWNKLFGRLLVLRENTDDEVLKEKLTQYLNSKEQELQELKENGDKYYIYVLRIQEEVEEDYFVEGFFFDYQLAYEQGMAYYEEFSAYSFRIDKCPIYGTPVLEQGSCLCRPYPGDSAIIFKNGEIYYFYAKESNYDDEYFDFYFEVPNPFEQGDFVKIVNSEECGVVSTSQKMWAKDVRRRLSEKRDISDCTDIMISVLFLDEDGYLDDSDSISPLRLERYQPNRQS